MQYIKVEIMILNFLVSGRLDFVALGLKRPFRFCLEGEAEPQNPPNIAPVCAANIHRQKGGLERT